MCVIGHPKQPNGTLKSFQPTRQLIASLLHQLFHRAAAISKHLRFPIGTLRTMFIRAWLPHFVISHDELNYRNDHPLPEGS
jgi:hypothetical protein